MLFDGKTRKPEHMDMHRNVRMNGIEISVAAVALGAAVIEKHFTLNKGMEGPDHKASLEPWELEKLVRAIRNIEKALGNGEKVPSNSEKKNKNAARKLNESLNKR